MILIGSENIPFEDIEFIHNKEQINTTKPNSTVIFEFNLELMKYCQENTISYGVVVKSIKEAIFANALYARYIILNKKLAPQIQELATNYMFDSKVLAKIEKDEEIEELALKNIDGVIYTKILKNK